MPRTPSVGSMKDSEFPIVSVHLALLEMAYKSADPNHNLAMSEIIVGYLLPAFLIPGLFTF